MQFPVNHDFEGRRVSLVSATNWAHAGLANEAPAVAAGKQVFPAAPPPINLQAELTPSSPLSESVAGQKLATCKQCAKGNGTQVFVTGRYRPIGMLIGGLEASPPGRIYPECP